MRQRFFTSTAQTRLIKNILANTPLPIYDTVRPGDYIIKNCKYIYNISLIKCTTSGLLEGDGEFITLDDSFYWGASILNHTEKLKDATGFYDSKVHEWLGRYLRAYRDMKGIDLMPFYNCFSGVYTSRFKLIPVSYINNYTDDSQNVSSVVGSKITVYESDQSYDTYSQGTDDFNSKYVEQSGYKILQIPIKLNRTYTIAIDCDSTVRIAPAFINHGHLVKVKIGTSELDLTNILIDNADGSGIISPISVEKTNTVFIKPFTIFINSKSQKVVNDLTTEEDIGITYEQILQRYEKYLYLLIQLPKDNTSSAVILEGDYTELSSKKIFSLEDISMTVDDTYDEFESATASIISTDSNDSLEFKEPYISYLNIPNLPFKDTGELACNILSITSDNISSYGYVEYFFKQGTINSNTYNLQIASYVPIPEDDTFTVKWFLPINSDPAYTYPTNNIVNDSELLDKLLLSKLSLLQFNDQKNYPFADRLIEYLTLNVIDSADEISDNVKRTQDSFHVKGGKDYTYGVWNNYLRTIIYLDTMNFNKVTHFDNNGYVDRTVESMLINPIWNIDNTGVPLPNNSYTYPYNKELREAVNKVAVVSQPTINSKSDVVKDSNLINPSTLTYVQNLINKDNMR